jgi:cytochrome P450
VSNPSSAALPPGAPLPAALQIVAMRRWPLASLERLRERHGSRFTVRIPDVPPLVFLSAAQDLAELFAQDDERLRPGAGSFTLRPLLGEGSFMLRDGAEHANVRSALAGALGRGTETRHAAAISRLAIAQVETWPTDTPITTGWRLRALALDVATSVALGWSGDDVPRVAQMVREMLSATTSLVLLEPKLRHLPAWHGRWARLQRRRADVVATLTRIVARRRDEQDGSGDLLDALLRARSAEAQPLSDAEVVDDLLSVMVAGHETTAAVLTWGLQFLAHHRSVQQQLIEEIDAAKGEEYLAATVLELLRHAPVFVFAMPRAVASDVEIGGRTYPRGVLLMPCTYLLHHDPELYPEPHRFRPERFLGSAPAGVAWVPWGGPRRRCLGRHLAMLEIATTLKALLATREVLPARGRIEPARWRTAILAPRHEGRVILRRRQGT